MNLKSKVVNKESSLNGIKNYVAALKKIDFELAYLALLTREGIKPLSRWEKPLNDKEIELLRAMDLLTKQITRIVKTGPEVIETVFSRIPACLEIYANRFENKPVEKDSETQRFEGFLFGYPPCCIEHYILKPYSANNLNEKDQKILFHWACNNCKITPFLLCFYQKIYIELENVWIYKKVFKNL